MCLDFDIAVVGGGIAGLSVAREVSQKCDAKIAVVEKRKRIGHPSHSHPFTFVETIRKFGLTEAVERYYSKAGIYSFLGGKVVYEFETPRLATLNYAKTCQELLLKCRTKNLQLFTETKAVGMRKKGTNVMLDLKGQLEGSVECHLVIDASGSSFFSTRFASFRRPRFYSHPYGYQLDDCRIPNNFLDQISFFVGRSIGSGGGWFYPITDKRASFGVAEISNSPFFPFLELEKKYKFAMKNMQPFCSMVCNAVPLERRWGTIPAEPMKKLVADNLMRVGDSAGHATPHILEGIRPTIEFGTLCGSFTVEAFKKEDYSKRFLKKYQISWQAQNKLLYLYLLSIAKAVFSRDDCQQERAISLLAEGNIDPKMYLNHLRGSFGFPYTLLDNIRKCHFKTLAKFTYHNINWLVE